MLNLLPLGIHAASSAPQTLAAGEVHTILLTGGASSSVVIEYQTGDGSWREVGSLRGYSIEKTYWRAEGPITYRVTRISGRGDFSGAIADNGDGAVIPAPAIPAPVNVTPPLIAGSGDVGTLLTVTPGVWQNVPVVAGQWSTGSTGQTYRVKQSDAGTAISYTETGSNPTDSVVVNSNAINIPAAPGDVALNTLVAMEGNSLAAFEWGMGDIRTRRLVGGMGFWWQYLSGGRVDIPRSLNFGIGGGSSEEIRDRLVSTSLPAFLASGADTLVLTPMQGNDRTPGRDMTAAASISAIESALTAAVATGKQIIYIGSTPRAASQMDAHQIDNFHTVRLWEDTTLPTFATNLTFVTVFDQFTDEDGISPIPNTLVDSVHWGAPIAKAIAERVIAATAGKYAPRDIINEISAGGTNLFPNPTFEGSGGNHVGSGTVIGSIPNNTSIGNTGGGKTVTFTPSVLDGDAALQIAVTSPNGGEGPWYFHDFPAGTISNGDTVRFALRVRVHAGFANVLGIHVGLNIGNSPTTHVRCEGYFASNERGLDGSGSDGVIFTEPVLVEGVGSNPTRFGISLRSPQSTGINAAHTITIAKPVVIRVN